MFSFQVPTRLRKLERRVADLEAELQARDRVIRVLEAERDQLCEVIARDRGRIAAETATFARQRAEAEGGPHGPAE